MGEEWLPADFRSDAWLLGRLVKLSDGDCGRINLADTKQPAVYGAGFAQVNRELRIRPFDSAQGLTS